MYNALEDILFASKEKQLPMWKVIQLDDCFDQGIQEEQSFQKMATLYQAMKDTDQNYDPLQKSNSGLTGGEAEKIHQARMNHTMLVDDFVGEIMERALKTASCNACMKRIVAAPTAGSCGVLPAVLLSLQHKKGFDNQKMIEALYISAGIGSVIAKRASLSGAEGGCQAEIGSASAMAAGAYVYLSGGTNEMILHAVALSLKGMLGLVCDPVAGLVEVPCVKRNVIGAVNAATSAEMALAGIESVIPADEVIDAMRQVGHAMAKELRETAQGGLATTETGLQIKKRISMD